MLQVLSKGEIVHHGFTEASVKGSQPVITGEVSFKLSVSPGMAPSVQVLAYCVLPSETVLAESRTFSTEKCFRNKVPQHSLSQGTSLHQGIHLI